MGSLLARDLALGKLVGWGGPITSHWTGARSACFSSARLGCLVRDLRARSIPPLCVSSRSAKKHEANCPICFGRFPFFAGLCSEISSSQTWLGSDISFRAYQK